MTASRLSWVVLGVGALALAGAAGLVLWRGRAAAPVSDAHLARMRALEARVALLEARRLGRTLGTPPDSRGGREPRLVVPVAPEEARATGSDPRPAAAPPAVSAQVALDEAAVEREYFGELDARLAAETRDPVWSAATEERLRGSTEDLRSIISVDAARCGSSLCRVDTTVVQPQEEAQALNRFLSAAIAVLPDAVVREGDQPGRRIVYFARHPDVIPPMLPPER